MSYPISNEHIKDAYTRGQVSMFAKIVEYRNNHPQAISEDAINDLYEEVESYCLLGTKFSLLVRGEEVTE